MKIRKIVAACFCIALTGAAAAQSIFNFDDIPGVSQEPAVSVDINPVMIGFVREMWRESDPAGADLLNGLRGISLRVYHDVDSTRQFNRFIDNVAEELEGSGWLPVVTAQDEGSKVRMHMQMTNQEVSGMTVMVADGAEAIFITIDGTVSAQDLGRVLAMLPMDQLGAMGLPGLMAPPARTPPADVASE